MRRKPRCRQGRFGLVVCIPCAFLASARVSQFSPSWTGPVALPGSGCTAMRCSSRDPRKPNRVQREVMSGLALACQHLPREEEPSAVLVLPRAWVVFRAALLPPALGWRRSSRLGPGCWWHPGALPAPHPSLPAEGNGLPVSGTRGSAVPVLSAVQRVPSNLQCNIWRGSFLP